MQAEGTVQHSTVLYSAASWRHRYSIMAKDLNLSCEVCTRYEYEYGSGCPQGIITISSKLLQYRIRVHKGVVAS